MLGVELDGLGGHPERALARLVAADEAGRVHEGGALHAGLGNQLVVPAGGILR